MGLYLLKTKLTGLLGNKDKYYKNVITEIRFEINIWIAYYVLVFATGHISFLKADSISCNSSVLKTE